MHHRAHLLWRQVQVFATFIGAQEAVTLGIGQHATGDQVQLLGGGVTAAPAQQQLAVAHHGAKPLAQRVEVGFVMNLQRLGNACLGQQFGALLEQGEDRLAAGDRARITLRLAIGMRITRGACSSLGALVWCGSGARRPLGGTLWRARTLRAIGMGIVGMGGSFSGHSMSL